MDPQRAVIDYALQRGLLSGQALEAAQREVASSGGQVRLLAVLRARYLSPQAVQELETVYEVAQRGPAAPGGERAIADPPPGTPAESEIQTGVREGQEVRGFGNYEVLSEIARGGMGVVYRARDRTLGRIVAIKVLLGDSERQRIRFRLEARALSLMQHPNVIPIYEVGETPQGVPYLVMAFFKGGSLGDRLRREGPLPVREAAEVVKKLADALHHAHRQMILHRDVKPDNVLLSEQGEPLLTDFGLAKLLEGESGPTISGGVLGTPAFMPPEQAGTAGVVDWRADVYSLGATLYTLLTGSPLFECATYVETLVQVTSVEAPPPSRLRPEVPRDLDTICLECLEKEPNERYASAQELAEDLERFLADKPIQAVPATRSDRIVKWARRNRTTVRVGLAALSLLMLGGVGAALWAGRLREGERADRIAAARDRAQSLAAERDEAPEGDLDAQIGAALAALQAAQEWRLRDRDEPQATRANFEAALALGKLAHRGEQWRLAKEAFAQAGELDVDDEEAARLAQAANQAATREADRRAREVQSWLDRVGTGELRRVPDGLVEAEFAIVRYPDAQTVALLSERLRSVIDLAFAAEAKILRALEEPDSSELSSGEGRLDLSEVIERRRTPLPKEETEQAARLERLLSAALERLAGRHLKHVLPRSGGRGLAGSQVLALKVGEALGPGNLDLLRVCCATLGRIGIRPGATEALELYLRVEADARRALWANKALVRLDLEAASLILANFAKRFGVGHSATRELQSFVGTCVGGRKLSPQGPDEGRTQDLADTFEEARRLEAVGALGKARAAYDALLARDEDHAPARIRRGVLRTQAKDYEGANEDFSRVLSKEARNVEALLNRAELHRVCKRLDSAEADVRTALEINAREPAGWLVKGLILMDLGRTSEAIAAFDRLLALEPEDVQGLNRRGLLRSQTGDVSGARADFRTSLRIAPDQADALSGLGRVHVEQRQPQEAIKCLTRAMELAPKDPTHPTFRAHAWRLAGDFGRAIKDFEAALRLQPDHPSALDGLSTMLGQTGRVKEAVKILDRLLEITPKDVVRIANRGNFRLNLGDHQGALADYNRAIKTDPTYAFAWTNRGNLYRLARQHGQAIKDHNEALRLNPKLGLAYSNRGTSYLQLGMHPEAEADFTQALQLDPRGADYLNRGNARLAQRKLGEAEADFREHTRRFPRDAVAWASLSGVLRVQGRSNQALEAATQGIRVNPREPVAWLARGMVKRSAKEVSQARKDLAEALRLMGPKHPHRSLAAKELQRLGPER